MLEASVYLREGDVPQAGIPVTWTVVETGQAFGATSTSNGFARVDAPPSAVLGTPVTVEISAVDASQSSDVQGTRPAA